MHAEWEESKEKGKKESTHTLTRARVCVCAATLWDSDIHCRNRNLRHIYALKKRSNRLDFSQFAAFGLIDICVNQIRNRHLCCVCIVISFQLLSHLSFELCCLCIVWFMRFLAPQMNDITNHFGMMTYSRWRILINHNACKYCSGPLIDSLSIARICIVHWVQCSCYQIVQWSTQT